MFSAWTEGAEQKFWVPGNSATFPLQAETERRQQQHVTAISDIFIQDRCHVASFASWHGTHLKWSDDSCSSIGVFSTDVQVVKTLHPAALQSKCRTVAPQRPTKCCLSPELSWTASSSSLGKGAGIRLHRIPFASRRAS